jgi:CheY-like chemotaxis protein
MVYGIVNGHRGSIQVDSEQGKGTTFHIYLPAAGKEAEETTAFHAKPLGRERKTILVVDDEDVILNVTKDLLEFLGYEVITVSSGEAALEIYHAKGKQIDLILLDMVMPVMGGRETFAQLKAIDPQVNVILSTGYSLTGQAAGMMDAGCRAFIQKPYKMEELSETIRIVLDHPADG